MNFLHYLKVYEKEETSKVEKIVESDNKKMDAILKEAFWGDFISKDEAVLRIENEFVDTNRAPKSVDIAYVKENMNKIKDKVENLTEGEIKIIIHNNEMPKGGGLGALNIPVGGSGCGCEIEMEESAPKKKRGRGRPKKQIGGPVEDKVAVDEEKKEEPVVEGKNDVRPILSSIRSSLESVMKDGEGKSAMSDLSGAISNLKDVENLSDFKADAEIDADGLLVLPGAVDTHVHFNDEFMGTKSVHDYYTGTLAAAFGGVTSIVDFSNQTTDGSLTDTVKIKKEEARGNALIDWGVHPVITRPDKDTLKEIEEVVKLGAPTIKCYMTYRDEGLMMEIEDLKRIQIALRDAGGMLMIHAEDNDIIETNIPMMINSGFTKPVYHAESRPPKTENRAISRLIEMVSETGGRLFIVHMATPDGIEYAGKARAEGIDIIAETCTHYLVFTKEMLERDDGIKWICSPPLRDKETSDRLWEGLRTGIISMVTSDDAAYSWEAKLCGAERFDKCPNGIPGIETRLSILYSEGVAKGKISLPRFVELVSTAPAVLFGLAPKKGSLLPGADADIVMFDPETEWIMGKKSLHMAADWSAYENIRIKGKIQKVFSRGELIIDGDRCLAEKGRGRFLHRKLDMSVHT